MKRKNFTSLPNDFLLDEKKEHNATQLIKNATEKLIVIIFEGLQAKFGPNFQKSENELANMCLIARSTFNNNVENLINKGVITQTVVHKKGKKNNETSYWTLNLTFDFEEIEQNDVGLNSVKVENDTTAPIENDTRVDSNSVKGCPNIGQLKDFKDFKELEEEEIYNNNTRNVEFFNHYINQNEITGMSEILTKEGFKHDTIKSIQGKTAHKLVTKEIRLMELRNDVIEKALIAFDKDKNNNIRSYSGLFVYKLIQAIENKNRDIAKREKLEKEREEYENKKTVGGMPFYNWLEN